MAQAGTPIHTPFSASLTAEEINNVDEALAYLKKSWHYLPPHVRESVFTLIDAAMAKQVNEELKAQEV